MIRRAQVGSSGRCPQLLRVSLSKRLWYITGLPTQSPQLGAPNVPQPARRFARSRLLRLRQFRSASRRFLLNAVPHCRHSRGHRKRGLHISRGCATPPDRSRTPIVQRLSVTLLTCFPWESFLVGDNPAGDCKTRLRVRITQYDFSLDSGPDVLRSSPPAQKLVKEQTGNLCRNLFQRHLNGCERGRRVLTNGLVTAAYDGHILRHRVTRKLQGRNSGHRIFV